VTIEIFSAVVFTYFANACPKSAVTEEMEEFGGFGVGEIVGGDGVVAQHLHQWLVILWDVGAIFLNFFGGFKSYG